METSRRTTSEILIDNLSSLQRQGEIALKLDTIQNRLMVENATLSFPEACLQALDEFLAALDATSDDVDRSTKASITPTGFRE